MATYDREAEAARGIARAAGELALSWHGRGIAFESKSDLSPVTLADREAESLIARRLEESFPEDGILGEEGSRKPSRSGRRWIVDPIDGTRDFIRGTPAWAVLLALEEDGEVVAGAAFLPSMGDLFWAARGSGAWCNDRRVRVSNAASPAEALLCVNGLNALRRYAFAPRLLEWMEPFWAVRSMGGCLDAVMVVRGQADIWLEPTGQPWDFAPFQVLAEEAGARFFDFQGRPTIHGGNCIICAPGLESEARRLLGL